MSVGVTVQSSDDVLVASNLGGDPKPSSRVSLGSLIPTSWNRNSTYELGYQGPKRALKCWAELQQGLRVKLQNTVSNKLSINWHCSKIATPSESTNNDRIKFTWQSNHVSKWRRMRNFTALLPLTHLRNPAPQRHFFSHIEKIIETVPK